MKSMVITLGGPLVGETDSVVVCKCNAANVYNRCECKGHRHGTDSLVKLSIAEATMPR